MCGATHPSQMGAQAENSAVDALLRTIDQIVNASSQKKASNKFPLRPAVLTHNIEGTFNQVHPATLREVMLQRWIPVTLGLYRNRSVERIEGNQATFENSQRNNLRSCMWVSVVVFGLSPPRPWREGFDIYRSGAG